MSPARLPILSPRWRGKKCQIVFVKDLAYLTKTGAGAETYLLDGRTVTAPNGEYIVMQNGCGKGLESKDGALSGRCVAARAISLAVHLGVSAIYLASGEPVDPRARRNLETLIRPLKSRRISIHADASLGTPFPKSEP